MHITLQYNIEFRGQLVRVDETVSDAQAMRGLQAEAR